MTVIAYVALGSNLGDRRSWIDQAFHRLATIPGVRLTRRSSLYETAPVGGPAGQGAYLNGVVELTVDTGAEELLARLQQIETDLGRVRTVKDGPRTIDLDVLLYGEQILDTPPLTIPHPRLHERLFVLEPLKEIAPGVVHPILKKTISQLYAELLGISPIGMIPGRELMGYRVLVTGSTSGIGRAIALELAEAGASVLIHGRRSRERAEEVADAVRRWGGRSEVILADLRQRSEVEHLAEQAWNHWQGLDVVVNNAGADTLTGEAKTWPFERKLEELLAVDVQATIFLSRTLGKRMKEQGAGVVLTMGWDQAETGMEGDSGELFATSKGAIMAFTRSLALSLSPEVRVHCLAPGWIRTAWGETASSDWQERVRRETPLQVWGTPEDVAKSARWLVSPGASYLQGQIVRVNGGAVR